MVKESYYYPPPLFIVQEEEIHQTWDVFSQVLPNLDFAESFIRSDEKKRKSNVYLIGKEKNNCSHQSNQDGKRVIKTRRVPARREPIRDNEINTNPILEIRRPMFITTMERKLRFILKLGFRFLDLRLRFYDFRIFTVFGLQWFSDFHNYTIHIHSKIKRTLPVHCKFMKQ